MMQNFATPSPQKVKKTTKKTNKQKPNKQKQKQIKDLPP